MIAEKYDICYNTSMTNNKDPFAGIQDWSLPSGREVYDTLMRRINPELVTDKLPHLDDGFADETPEQRNVRYAKYQEDFAQYNEAYAQWIEQTKAAADSYCRQALQSAES